MAKGEKYCVLCSEKKTNVQLAKHRNELVSYGYGFCKDCLNQSAHESEEDIIGVLRLLNIPYVSDVWESAVDTGGENVFTKYIQLIAPKRKYKNFMDSDFLNDVEEEHSRQDIIDTVDFTVTNDVIERWGMQDSDKTYMDFEIAYKSLCKVKEPMTTLEQKRYAQNVKLGKALDGALETGDASAIPKLRTAYTKDLEELGLNIDMSGQEEGRSLGMRIKEWEMTAPIPTTDELDDVDNVKDYVYKWFTLQMKRVFGLASDEEISKLYE